MPVYKNVRKPLRTRGYVLSARQRAKEAEAAFTVRDIEEKLVTIIKF